jgi:hypothetical protein
MNRLSLICVSLLFTGIVQAQKAVPLPVFDVHVHVSKINPNMPSQPLCPWFLSDMPGADPNDKAGSGFSFMSADCLDPWILQKR